LTLFEAALPQPSAPEHNSGNGPRKLSDLSPSEFERYIAKLYARMGYKAKVTPQSHDHGVDIFARRYSATGEETLLIQCKHKIGGTVGEAAVRDLIGALQIYHQANAAHLVTSGSFSTAAITLANQHRIHLVDYLSLKTLADSFKQQ
jgi:restriction system protein